MNLFQNVPLDVARLLSSSTPASCCFQHRGQFLLFSHGWKTSSRSRRLTNTKEAQRKVDDSAFTSDILGHPSVEGIILKGAWCQCCSLCHPLQAKTEVKLGISEILHKFYFSSCHDLQWSDGKTALLDECLSPKRQKKFPTRQKEAFKNHYLSLYPKSVEAQQRVLHLPLLGHFSLNH